MTGVQTCALPILWIPLPAFFGVFSYISEFFSHTKHVLVKNLDRSSGPIRLLAGLSFVVLVIVVKSLQYPS